MSAPEKLGECFGIDLAGHTLTFAYYLHINHGLMGFHPAILREDPEGDDTFIVARRRSDLKIVWDELPPCRAKIGVFLGLIHEASGRIFDVSGDIDRLRSRKPLRVYSAAELTKLVDSPGFQWAPGVLSLTDDSHASPPDFSDDAAA